MFCYQIRQSSFSKTYYVYYETGILHERTEIIVAHGFKTKEQAHEWINNEPDGSCWKEGGFE